jgi:glycosyltransferase involved in cell wall biosynthesis
VCTFHDLFVMTGEYSTPEFRARFTAQAREAARRADLIIAVSHFTAGQVSGLLGFDPARVRVVPHGVRPRPAVGALEPSVVPLVLSVGAIQRRKNTQRLVEAFERALPAPWRLVLAGGAGYGATEIFARIAASPARERIEVTGYVSDEELERLYRSATLFAFPSLDEGFGMPVLDAMARGVPVLTARSSACAEVAADAALLVDPAESGAIAEGLRSLAGDGELREHYRRLGLERAKQFSWERAAIATWAAYQEVLAG